MLSISRSCPGFYLTGVLTPANLGALLPAYCQDRWASQKEGVTVGQSWMLKPKFLVFVPLALLLIVALACGEDATSTPRPTSTPAPAAPTATSAPAAPTATLAPILAPTPTPLPAATALGPATPTAPPVKSGLEPIYGGIIPMSQIADCGTFDPHRGRTSIDLQCGTQMYSNLLEYDPLRPGVVRCDVCTDFTVSPDGKSFTFNLIKGIKFHDGVELTAEDVAFSFERMSDPVAPRPTTGTIKQYFDRVEVVDKYTVIVHNKAAAPVFVRMIGTDFFKVMPKHWIEAGNDPHQHGNILGSGPFLPVDYKEAVSHEAKKNPNYFREGKPYIDGIEGFVLSDPGTEVAAYRTEKVMMAAHTQQGIESLTRLARDNDFLKKVDIWWQPGINGIHLIVNTQKPPFDNPKVREAMNLALYRQPILEQIGGGRFTIGKPMGPSNPYALPDEEILQRPGYRDLNGEKHPDDIARARQLWAEAGFSASNKMVAVINSPDSKPHPDAAQVYKAQLEDALVNIDLTFQNMDLGAWAAYMKEGPYDMSASGKGGAIADPDSRFALIYLTGPRNWARQEISGVKELFDRQSKEFDAEKRRDINYEMQRLVLDNQPGTMEIAWETQGIFVHKRIMTKAGHFVLTAGRQMSQQHYHEWILPETPDRPAFGADPGFGGN